MPLLFLLVLLAVTTILVGLGIGDTVRHSWPVPIAIALYLSPYAGTAILLANPLLQHFKSMRLSGSVWKQTLRYARFRSFIGPLDVFFNWNAESQLPLITRILSTVISGIGAILSWPIVTFYGALIYRFDSKMQLRRFDASWKCLIVILGYVVGSNGHPIVSSCLAIVVIVVELESLISTMQLRRGVVSFFLYDESLGRVSLVVKKALIIFLGFSCLHFSICAKNPSSYNMPLSVFDSLYFSLVTFSTVGYGDIFPKTHWAKAACMGEIGSGILTLILGVNIAISIWLQEHQPSGTDTFETRVRQLQRKNADE